MERALPKTLQNAIAKKYAAIVDKGWTERDDFGGTWSHWVYLKRGYHNAALDPSPGLHIIHESTVKEILSQLAGVQPCDCDECKR